MIALLVGWLAPTVGEKAAKPLAWALIVIAAIGLFFGVKTLYDHHVIARHDAGIEASQAKADRKADQQAADARVIDITRETQEEDQLQKAIKNAPQDPQIDDNLECRRAMFRCLRLQQRARENRLEPPACV